MTTGSKDWEKRDQNEASSRPDDECVSLHRLRTKWCIGMLDLPCSSWNWLRRTKSDPDQRFSAQDTYP